MPIRSEFGKIYLGITALVTFWTLGMPCISLMAETKVDGSSRPIFQNSKDWISEIQTIKSGLKLLVDEELKNAYVAVFAVNDSELLVCTYNNTTHDVTGVSYEIRDANGKELLDVSKVKALKPPYLLKIYKVRISLISSWDNTVIYGMYYPLKTPYHGKAYLVYTSNNESKKIEFQL